jgi:16S rRNA (cytidine1402-2'-O)-methyltransferase
MNPVLIDESCRPVPGTLYVLATPIGHLADLAPRAAQLLAQVDLIAAEDTRVTQRLLDASRVAGRFLSLNEHNEAGRIDALLRALEAGQSVALVSDAGTPLISDPGYRLVEAAQAAGVTVSPVPGPCAAIAALSAAGLPSDRFCFEGFLPARSAARCKRLAELVEVSATLIFYVPARDLAEVLADLSRVFGPDRLACLGRELTKRHETVHRDRLGQLEQFVRDDPDQRRGEAVLVVAGSPETRPGIAIDALAAELAAELPHSRAAALLARVSGLKRKAAWSLIEQKRHSRTENDA